MRTGVCTKRHPINPKGLAAAAMAASNPASQQMTTGLLKVPLVADTLMPFRV